MSKETQMVPKYRQIKTKITNEVMLTKPNSIFGNKPSLKRVTATPVSHVHDTTKRVKLNEVSAESVLIPEKSLGNSKFELEDASSLNFENSANESSVTFSQEHPQEHWPMTSKICPTRDTPIELSEKSPNNVKFPLETSKLLENTIICPHEMLKNSFEHPVTDKQDGLPLSLVDIKLREKVESVPKNVKVNIKVSVNIPYKECKQPIIENSDDAKLSSLSTVSKALLKSKEKYFIEKNKMLAAVPRGKRFDNLKECKQEKRPLEMQERYNESKKKIEIKNENESEEQKESEEQNYSDILTDTVHKETKTTLRAIKLKKNKYVIKQAINNGTDRPINEIRKTSTNEEKNNFDISSRKRKCLDLHIKNEERLTKKQKEEDERTQTNSTHTPIFMAEVNKIGRMPDDDDHEIPLTQNYKHEQNFKDLNDSKDAEHLKDTKVSKDVSNGKDGRYSKVSKDSKDAKNSKDCNDFKESKDSNDAEILKDIKVSKDVRNLKDVKNSKAAKDSDHAENLNEMKISKEVRDAKDNVKQNISKYPRNFKTLENENKRKTDSKQREKTPQSAKLEKKMLEAKVKELASRERTHLADSLRMREVIQAETVKRNRANKREMAAMLCELKAKEKAIETLTVKLAKHQQINIPSDCGVMGGRLVNGNVGSNLCAKSSKNFTLANANKLREKFNNNSKPPKAPKPSINSSTTTNGSNVGCAIQPDTGGPDLESLLLKINEQNETIRNLHKQLDVHSSESTSNADVQEGDPEGPVGPDGPASLIHLEALDSGSVISAHEELSTFPWVEIPALTMNKHEPKSLDFTLSKLQTGSNSNHGFASSFLINSNRRELLLIEENEGLKGDLQELRDHADLLEFRIFEFSEGIQKASGVPLPTCHQSTSTDELGVTLYDLDLSLPFSVDSGVEVQFDAPKYRISEYRRSLSRLSSAAPSESHSVHQLNNLIDWLANNGGPKTSPCGTPITPLSPKTTKMEVHPLESLKVGVDESQITLDSELASLAQRLQESLDDPGSQEAVLVEAVSKLHVLSASLSALQCKVDSLATENTNLTDALSALSDSHETRTEASATESDQVHRKSPSYPSDLSDTESDESPRHSAHPQKRIQDLTTSFQESGIFEGDSEGGIHAYTQTDDELYEPWNLSKEMKCDYIQTESENDFSNGDSITNINRKKKSKKNSMVGSDVDLQTAIARLTQIKDVVEENDIRTFRLQELQESDEYLLSENTEGAEQRVTLLKSDYDNILANERNLTHQLEQSSCEKEQFASQVVTLEEQLRKALKNDCAEVLRGEIRVLEQRLDASEHYRRQFFDEKCEFEEAENDARLLSQRLDSQLEAAHEMESLLSASLSQEQEFSRELQRRVRELQMIDKGRRIHEEVLEAEARSCRDKEAAALCDSQRYLQKLAFVLYGLALSQIWRGFASNNVKSVVPHKKYAQNLTAVLSDMSQWIDSSTMTPDYVQDTLWCNGDASTEEMMKMEYNRDESCHQRNLKISPDATNGTNRCANSKTCDNFLDINYSDTSHTSFTTSNSSNNSPNSFNTDHNCSPTPQLYINLCDSETQTEIRLKRDVGTQCSGDLSKFRNGRVKNVGSDHGNVSDKSANQNGLSDREEFYLSQIEGLQSDKRSMRKDFEAENSEIYSQIHELQSRVDIMSEAWKAAEDEKQRLMLKLEECQNEAMETERSLQRRTKELKEDLRTSIDVLNREQEVLQRQYEEQLSGLRTRTSDYEERISSLMLQFNTVKTQLANFIEVEDDEVGCERGGGMFSDLVAAVKALLRSESTYKQRVEDLEKKDHAYQETIKEADRLMTNHATVYTGRIEDLEASLEQKKLRISQLESSEDRLRSSMRKTKKSSEDGEKISELLDKLLETENSELQLKEKVWALERTEKELRIKSVEAEKAHQNLKLELRDQEELVQRLMSLTTENNALTSQLQEAHECSRRASEMQQSENYLKGRVEELESSEISLRETMCDNEKVIKIRERKQREVGQNLQEEICNLKGLLEKERTEWSQSKEIENVLREQLEKYRDRALSMDKEMSETQLTETQHRQEVMKLRSQLKVCNSQLTDFDVLNGEIREKLAFTEEALKSMENQLEEHSRRHENELLTINLELSRNQSRADEAEVQLSNASFSHCDNAAVELDCLSSLPVEEMKNALDNVFEMSKTCISCGLSSSDDFNMLQQSVKQLNEIVNGKLTNSDSDSEESELQKSHSNDDENHPETPCLDDINNYGETPLNSAVPMPPVPPRPRRDAKRKRRTRPGDSSLKNHRRTAEGSLMDELEEGVFGTSPGSFKVLQEYEERIEQLEEDLAKKEEELKLADGESAELHCRLVEGDEELTKKAKEISDLNLSLSGLRKQLVSTVQEYEHSKSTVEAQHKVMVESLNEKVEALASALSALGERTLIKDVIIQTLVKQIMDILRSGNMGVVITQVRLLGNVGRHFERADYPDFDVDTLCKLMAQADENDSVMGKELLQL